MHVNFLIFLFLVEIFFQFYYCQKLLLMVNLNVVAILQFYSLSFYLLSTHVTQLLFWGLLLVLKYSKVRARWNCNRRLTLKKTFTRLLFFRTIISFFFFFCLIWSNFFYSPRTNTLSIVIILCTILCDDRKHQFIYFIIFFLHD